MRMEQVGVIARREYAATVKRREFLLMTFGLPFFYVLLIGLVSIVTGNSMKNGDDNRQAAVKTKPPGFYDASGLLDAAVLRRPRKNQPAPLVFPTLEAGQKAVQNKQIRVLVSVDKDFAKNGRINLWQPAAAQSDSLFGEAKGDPSSAWEPTIKRALLANKVPPEILPTAIYPLSGRTFSLNKETGKWEKPDPFRIVGKFVVPYLFSLLLIMSVAFSTSYLMHSIVEEKENRIIEILLSSTTHEELLAGKILGLGAVGLTQLGVWVSGAVGTLLISAALLPSSRGAFAASPGVVGVALLMFVLGFGLYASIMAGVGAMGTSWRESQQTAGLVVLPLTVPLMFLVALLQSPNGTLARVLSLFPPTAPIAMMLRVAAGGASNGEVVLSALLLVLSIWGVVLLSARLFRLSLLLTGQRPGPALVLKTLFARGAGGA